MEASERRHPGTQSVLAADGREIFRGQWDPRLLAGLLVESDPEWWRDKTVLDIGGNTGGLSLELARLGARVTIAEPDPYGNTIGRTRDVIGELAAAEGLQLAIDEADLFSCHSLERHEVVLCLGLLYHFRYPQLILDYLSSLEPRWLFLSSQTHPSDELALFNRASPGIMNPDYLAPETRLTGWHPTRPLLERMLEWAGFTEITDLTDRRYDFPQKPRGATNSAYYRARLESPVDPEALKPVFYPR